jgi:endonuclease/exonuclease/phosphatase (EEP) superfamily protein YafD
VLVTLLPWSWFLARSTSPVMEPVSVALPGIAGGLTILCLALAAVWSRPYAALAALSFLLVGVVAVAEPRTPQRSAAPDRPFRLVAANVFDENPRPRDAARTILGLEPQVVVAVETPEAVRRALADRFPNRSGGGGELGVYSVWPVEALGPVDGVPPGSATRVRVLRPGFPFVVYAVHLPNPLRETSFDRHLELVDALRAAALDETQPVVIAGDLNLNDRAEGYRRLHGRLRDAMRTGWASSTYDRGAWILLQLRIDHVFVSEDVCSAGAKVIDLPGSDHRAVRVQLGACR